MKELLFVVLGLIAVACATAVVTGRNPVRSALALMGFFLAISGLYLMLSAPFLAAAQVIICFCAIFVPFMFVILLLDLGPLDAEVGRSPLLALGTAGMLVVIGALALLPVLGALRTARFEPVGDEFGTTGLAEAAFGVYALPIGILSVLMLATIVGAVAMARRHVEDAEGTA